MKNDKIIIILSIVIIILVVIIGIFLFNANFTKEDTNIILSGNSTLYKGEPLTIKLTDKDGNGIGNQNITVTLTDSNGSIEEYNTITDSDGEGKIAINVNNSGQYTANIKYNGNNKYKESSITQGITIKDIVGNIQTNESNNKNKTFNSSKYKQEDSGIHQESDIINGWDPSEHEVSREELSDGNHKIYYDDGYYRICDEDGNVITYGY